MRLLNEKTKRVVESTNEEWDAERRVGWAIVNGVKVEYTIACSNDENYDPYRFGYIDAEEAEKIPPKPEKIMHFLISYPFSYGSINVIEEAAKACNVELVSVGGYLLADFPGNRQYFSERSMICNFALQSTSLEDAEKVIQLQLQEKLRELYRAEEAKEQETKCWKCGQSVRKLELVYGPADEETTRPELYHRACLEQLARDWERRSSYRKSDV